MDDPFLDFWFPASFPGWDGRRIDLFYRAMLILVHPGLIFAAGVKGIGFFFQRWFIFPGRRSRADNCIPRQSLGTRKSL